MEWRDKMKINTLSYRVFNGKEIVDRYPNFYVAHEATLIESTLIEFKSDILEFTIKTEIIDHRDFNIIIAKLFSTENVCKHAAHAFHKYLLFMQPRYMNFYDNCNNKRLTIHFKDVPTRELFGMMHKLLKIISECIEKEKEIGKTFQKQVANIHE